MSTYRIHAGDTLSALAGRFHTSVDALVKLNHIANKNLIYTGDTLKLPGKSDTFEPHHPHHPHVPNHPGHPHGGIHGSKKLAKASMNVADELPGSGYCAKGVNMAIERVTGWRPWANANELDNLLEKRPEFKELHISLEEALKIPGLVLTWEKSYGSAAGRTYGHTAITQGDGHSSSSDFVEGNTADVYRTGLRIFQLV